MTDIKTKKPRIAVRLSFLARLSSLLFCHRIVTGGGILWSSSEKGDEQKKSTQWMLFFNNIEFTA